MCKLQTQDVNFLLMHSCTQGSGAAVHLNLFFLLVFGQFLKKYISGFSPDRMLTMFSRVFLLAVCDPSPYDFDSQCEKYSQPIPTTSTSSTKALERWEDKHARLLIVSYTNLGSHTLPNNQFGRTFGSDASQFEWSLTGRSGITEGIPGFTYPGCQRLFMGGFRFRSSLWSRGF